MERSITGFHLDDENHWVAELDCGHNQHVRHKPPWQVREWVITAEGRHQHLGTTLGCVLCDGRELPENTSLRRRTRTFDQTNIPAALRSRHTTKRGVWAMVHVVHGALDWEIFGVTAARGRANAGDILIMPPEVEHRVELVGEASFFIDLLDGRQAASTT